MKSEFEIKNLSNDTITIDIEGVIGVTEELQFQNPEMRIATYEKFKSKITEIKKLNAKNIVVNIRSAGGSVNDAILIYEALKQIPAKITTRCYGYVASAATIIAQAADSNNREISSSALYLIHNSVGNIEGNSDELKQTLNLLEVTDKTISEIYASRSGQKGEIFSNLMAQNNGNGRWLSPSETLEFGLVDKIIDDDSSIENNADIITILGLPNIPSNDIDTKASIHQKIQQKWRDISKLLSNVITDSKSNTKNLENIQPQNETPKILTRDELFAIEMENKILSSKPTTLEHKEDPSIEKIAYSPNENAYNQDIEGFKL